MEEALQSENAVRNEPKKYRKETAGIKKKVQSPTPRKAKLKESGVGGIYVFTAH